MLVTSLELAISTHFDVITLITQCVMVQGPWGSQLLPTHHQVVRTCAAPGRSRLHNAVTYTFECNLKVQMTALCNLDDNTRSIQRQT